jgi:hypothetical protein
LSQDDVRFVVQSGDSPESTGQKSSLIAGKSLQNRGSLHVGQSSTGTAKIAGKTHRNAPVYTPGATENATDPELDIVLEAWDRLSKATKAMMAAVAREALKQ